MNRINQKVDHTLLKPIALKNDIKKLCEEAIQYNFFAVCVNGCYVKFAYDLLKNTNVKVATVVGFPLGAMATTAKVFEAQQAIKDGADEVDMVINVGALIDEDYTFVEDEIHQLKTAIGNKVLKVIIETCYLNSAQIEKATEIVVKSGADFVKTSTGFGTRGASFEDMETMQKVTQGNIEIKISGGVRDLETAQKYIKMGATRLGTSSGVKLVTGETPSKNSY